MLIRVANRNVQTPIAKTLQAVLTAVASGADEADDLRVRVYSYTEDFSELWGVDERNDADSQPLLEPADILVVVRERAEAPTDDLPEVGKHLTAIDWALWYVLNCQSKQVHVPTICIMDAANDQNRTDADRFFNMFPHRHVPSLPWIKLIPVVASSAMTGGIAGLLENLTVDHVKTTPDSDVIRQIWQSFFTRPTNPSDNHALANVIGAGLLTGDFGESASRRALHRFLVTLQLVPAGCSAEVVEQSANAVARRLHQVAERLLEFDRRRFTFLLVDDCDRRHHWADFLAKQLGLRKASRQTPDSTLAGTGQIGDRPTDLYSTPSVNDLLDSITAAISSDPPKPLSWCENSIPVDILFLDLRMFAGKRFADEAGLILRVIQIAEQYTTATASPAVDWPRFASSELRLVRDWAEKAMGGGKASREDEAYVLTLTLLPRLVAIIDCDLPIVIFSSTQRRRITDVLRPYGNIFTQFTKPALQLGYDSTVLQLVLESFEKATSESADLMLVRRLRRAFLKHQCDVYWRGHVEKPIDEPSGAPWTLQVLLDETGGDKERPDLTVGGFLVVYPPHVTLEEINQSIYANHPVLRQGKQALRQSDFLTLFWDIHENVLSPKNVLLFPLALTGDSDSAHSTHTSWFGSDVFRDPRVEDNLHRELIRSVLEIAIYVFSRQILPASAEVEFHFHPPTRAIPLGRSEAEHLNRVWGIRHGRHSAGRRLAFYFQSNDARPMVDELIREYQLSFFEPRAVSARAYGLSDDSEDRKRRVVSALHYLADTWLDAWRKSSAQKQDAPLMELALDGLYGDQIQCLLRSHRHLAHGRVAKSVATAATAVLSNKQQQTAIGSVIVALQDGAAAMTGPECVELAAILWSRPAETNRPPRKLSGVVESRDTFTGALRIRFAGRYFDAKPGQVRDSNLCPGERVRFVPQQGPRVLSFIARDVSRIPTSKEPQLQTETRDNA